MQHTAEKGLTFCCGGQGSTSKHLNHSAITVSGKERARPVALGVQAGQGELFSESALPSQVT